GTLAVFRVPRRCASLSGSGNFKRRLSRDEHRCKVFRGEGAMILLERLRADRFKGLRDVDLAFPARGSILVEGLNEAGKSTLVESVYFALYGALLASEDNRGGLESAIGYGADEATVELAFRVAETRLVVTRTIRRQRPSRARLRLWLADGSAEEVGQIA